VNTVPVDTNDIVNDGGTDLEGIKRRMVQDWLLMTKHAVLVPANPEFPYPEPINNQW